MEKIKTVLRDIQTVLRRKRNSIFSIFLICFFSLYLLFFTSNSWLPDFKSAKYFTQVDTVLYLENREFILKRWVWSQSQNMMEIEIDVKNNNFDNINNYQFSCRDRKGKAYKVVPIISENNMIVVQIQNVPNTFREFSFRIRVDYSEQEITRDNLSYVRMYTNNQMIEKTEHIEAQTLNEYYYLRVERTLINLQKERDSKQQSIIEVEEKMKAAQEDITNLISKREYSSKKDLEEVDKQIKNINSSITNFTLEKERLLDDLLEVNDLIQQTEQQLSEWTK